MIAPEIGGRSPPRPPCLGVLGIEQLVSSSVLASSNPYQHVLRIFSVSSDGQLTMLHEKSQLFADDNLGAAPVTFSRDGAHVYLVLPSYSVSQRINVPEDLCVRL